jgi:hypothetical protein
MYPIFSFFPKFDVGLDDSSSAAFFNYATTAMWDGPPPPVTIPRADGPGRGHKRPPPAIVCGDDGENFGTKILRKFSKIKNSKVACSVPAISPTGTPFPPVPAGREHVCHSATIADDGEGTLSQPSSPTCGKDGDNFEQKF